MSVHTDDAGVSVTSVITFVAEMFNEDERFELIKWEVDVSGPCLSQSFLVSFTNAYVNWGHVSSFTSWSWSLICLNLFFRAGMIFDSLPDLPLLITLVNSMQWTFWRWNLIFRTDEKASTHFGSRMWALRGNENSLPSEYSSKGAIKYYRAVLCAWRESGIFVTWCITRARTFGHVIEVH